MEDQSQEIQKIWQAIEQMKGEIVSPLHQHTGIDSNQVNWLSIYQKKLYVHHTIAGTAAATAANYGTFFIVPMPCVITGFREVHQTLGTDGGTVTVTLEKLTGTQAPDSGAAVLATALSLKATINTVQTGTLSNTLTSRSLSTGDRLGLKDAGVLTAVANVSVLVELTVI